MKKRVLTMLFAAFSILPIFGCSDDQMESDTPEYADSAFMSDLSESLMARWDEAAKLDQSGYDPYSKEYQEDLIALIDIELNNISEYRSATFEDRNLQEAAISYINILEDTKEAANLLTIDYEDYSLKWTESYNERSKAIAEFASDFGLTVDEAHQSELNDFIGTAQQIEDDEALQEKVNNMLAGLQFSATEQSGSYVTYSATLTNNTGADFAYINMTIDLIDENELILEQAYCNVGVLADGKSILLEFVSDKQFAAYQIHADYDFQR